MRVRAVLWAVLAASIPNAVAAQSVFKCLAGRSVTYSNTPCEKLGLQPGGEVPDRITTLPAVKPPPPRSTAATPQAAPAEKPGNAADAPKSAPLKPVNPLVEKLAK